MKQGILITAYKNFDHLIDIIRFFDDHFEIYIHIDKKCTPPAETLQRIRTLKNVKFVSSAYKVNWGGLNHLKSILLLAEEALKNPELSYIHLISGQDFPSKDVSYFKDFMHKSRRNDFLEYATMPAPFWSRGGMDRLEQYNFYDVFDARKYGKWIVKLITLQRMLKIKRPISSKVPQLYGGSTWWSLTRQTLQYVLTYTNQNKYLLRRLKHTFCAEEIYFQTVIMNSPHAGNVINDNLRYIDWNLRNGSIPAILDSTDFDRIRSSNKLFARKLEGPISNTLKTTLLQKNILN